jgi:hypothetical protein|nr:MAG TPA: Ead/Ea22-like protein [Caudoviricetes sp.]
MSNIDKLKSAAAKAVDNFDPNMFVETRDVLALLDELDAKDRRLNEILAPNMLLPAIDDMDEDNLRHVIKTVCENYSLLHAKWEAAENRAEAAEKRIAELERKEQHSERQSVIDALAGSGEEWNDIEEYMQKWDAERAAAAGKGE